jgi:hypothetical protein
MAEAAISAALSKLGELATSEAKILMEVGDNMTLLRDRLEWLQAFIRDADRRRRASTDDQLTRVWVRQTRTVSFQAEDALDEFIYQVSSSTYPAAFACVVIYSCVCICKFQFSTTLRKPLNATWLVYYDVLESRTSGCMMQIEGGDVERQLRLRPHKPPPAAPASGRHCTAAAACRAAAAEPKICPVRSASPPSLLPQFPHSFLC